MISFDDFFKFSDVWFNLRWKKIVGQFDYFNPHGVIFNQRKVRLMSYQSGLSLLDIYSNCHS